MQSTAPDASKHEGAEPRRDTWITLIAIGKLLKATILIVAGILAFRMLDGHGARDIHRAIARAGVAPSNHLVNDLLEKIGGLNRTRLEEIGVGSFIYAGLFCTEGLGLLFKKRWAEYFTIIITGSFIPLEIYEVTIHATAGRIIAVVLNAAAVAYLVWHVRHTKGTARTKRERGEGKRVVEAADGLSRLRD